MDTNSTDRRALGERAAYWRRQRHLTRRALAERLGRHPNWVYKIENGLLGSLERRGTAMTVADALGIDMQLLIGRDEQRPAGQIACIDHTVVEAIRAALESYGPYGMDQPPTLAGLQQQVTYAWAAFEHGHYGRLGQVLPSAIRAAAAACMAVAGSEQRQAAESLLSQVYQVTSSALRKLGEPNLAWIAADRAAQTVLAHEAKDPWRGNAMLRVGNALHALGRSDSALAGHMESLNQLSPGDGSSSEELLSTYGLTLLQAAMSTARRGHETTANELLTEASDVATALPKGADLLHTSFNSLNVELHQAAAMVELGQGQAAVEVHQRIDSSELRTLRTERRAHHALDIARAYMQMQHWSQAADCLTNAYQLAEAEIQCRPSATSILAELARRDQLDHLPPRLRDAAVTAGVPV